jgi:hypothetical protein
MYLGLFSVYPVTAKSRVDGLLLSVAVSPHVNLLIPFF